MAWDLRVEVLFMRTSDPSQSRRGIFQLLLRTARREQWTRKRGRRPVLELLEARALLTTITEYPTSAKTVVPTAITTGSDGNLWFIEQVGNAIVRLNPTTHAMTPFSNGLPAHAILSGITSGPNGALWFTETDLGANAIGTLDPHNTGQAIQNFGTANGMTAVSAPTGIAAAGGFIWFTEPLTDQIGRLDPTTDQIKEYRAPTAMTNLSSQMILGPDGNIWFTEFGAIGIFNPSTASLIKEVTLPHGSTEQPLSITVGPDGNIWYSAGILNAKRNGFVSYDIGTINTNLRSLSGAEIPLSVKPYAITAGPDGKIWFVVPRSGNVAGTINQLDPATRTVSQTLPVPTDVVAVPDPVGITAGPDRNLWFTDNGGAVGVVHLDVKGQGPPPTIIGESVVLIRKFNKKHKPTGKPILSGYTITFSTDMDQTSLADSANYQVALKLIKKQRVKVGNRTVRRNVTVLRPIGFSVSKVTTNSVILTLAGKQKFPKGGQITVFAAPPGGVDSAIHVFLDHNGILSISPKGTRITLIS
jgi:virginiamycin B lyase